MYINTDPNLIPGEEKGGFLGWLVLFFGTISMAAGGFGVLLSRHGAHPWQIKCYLVMLLMVCTFPEPSAFIYMNDFPSRQVALPQLTIGAYFVTHPKKATAMLMDSCATFEQHVRLTG